MQNNLSRGTIVNGEYEIIKRLGEGSFTSVYLVRSHQINSVFALKLYADFYVNNPNFQRRFEREFKIAKQFSHPNLLEYYASGVHEGQPYMIMEYVKGATLRELIAYHGRIPVKIAISIFCDALAGLAYLHGNGVVHRDIKPSSIFVDNGGIIKVADFDIAKRFKEDEGISEKGLPIGTQLYMAPEQRLGLPIDPRSDIFATGVTLYECITGTNPWKNSNFLPTDRRAWSKIIVPSKLIPDADTKLDAVIIQAMDLQPINRYSDASEMLAALKIFPSSRHDDVVRLVNGQRISNADIEESALPGSRIYHRRLSVLNIILILGITIVLLVLIVVAILIGMKAFG
jgi:serine/threonine-protein kinase